MALNLTDNWQMAKILTDNWHLYPLSRSSINNSSEEQAASTCIISCSGSQAPPIPRETILWSKLETLLVFSPDYNQSGFDCK